MTDLSQHYQYPEPQAPIGRSTHLSILWSPTPTSSVHHTTVTKTHRPMLDSAMREFGQLVTHHSRTEVLQVENVHTKWHNFVATTSEAFNRYFPAKRVTLHPSDAPWMTPSVKRPIRQRNWAFHSYPVQYFQETKEQSDTEKLRPRRQVIIQTKFTNSNSATRDSDMIRLRLCVVYKSSPLALFPVPHTSPLTQRRTR
ncbi:hypothetical protein E2C01_034350 [Portunus trituberculatus]|uniref:Uncharacterized protein n=1 Tax=Portunus trituberculatus TaxID=210409 RepID=A0A5B7F2M8_PORTR|nr:hypothetical protein [Portunus trituberculatus]